MDAKDIALLIGAFGGGTLLPTLVSHAWQWLTGRGTSRRSELERAWAASDREREKRRTVEDFASLCLRRLREAPCVPDESIPDWPRSTGPIDTRGGE